MNAIELSNREIETIYHKVLDELVKSITKNPMNLKEFIVEFKKYSEIQIEKSIHDILKRINNFNLNEKFIKTCIKMNRYKFEYLWCKESFEKKLEMVNKKAMAKKEKENKKPIVIVKPRMGIPTIVLD